MPSRHPRPSPEPIIRRSEDLALPPGEPVNWVLLDDATVEALARDETLKC